MKLLKESFRLNGLLYTQLKRNDAVVLYGIGGTYTDEPINYEVDKIYIRTDKFGTREHIPTNEVFGRDRSRSLITLKEASEYFDKLTAELKNPQEVLKVISGVKAAA
jgi:hypothetical protein